MLTKLPSPPDKLERAYSLYYEGVIVFSALRVRSYHYTRREPGAFRRLRVWFLLGKFGVFLEPGPGYVKVPLDKVQGFVPEAGIKDYIWHDVLYFYNNSKVLGERVLKDVILVGDNIEFLFSESFVPTLQNLLEYFKDLELDLPKTLKEDWIIWNTTKGWR